MSSSSLNVNVACLACDGTRPCADCRAAGRALAACGHRVHHSSRYATLRAAADGTYGFSACVLPLRAGERSVADAIVALLADARVAIAAEDAATLSARVPSNVVVFPRSDYLAGKLPQAWLDMLNGSPPADMERSSLLDRPPASGRDPARSVRSDATRRLRAISRPLVQQQPADATALLADELAWYRASDIGFGVLAVSVPGEAAEATAQALSGLLRDGDEVCVTARGCIAILAGADSAHVRRVASRLTTALRKRTGGAGKPSLGAALCPDDGITANALLAAAHARLSMSSRKRGE
ncbi:MAG TPA: hypothetical protein VKF82_07145 [Candidatus Eremiobacteraceae bacterium]|nr:hypothetical protein [Candidatus Eremiobacteraceae bacterium]